MRNADTFRQRAAVVALGEIGATAKEALPTLAKLASDKSFSFRSELADSIGKIGPSGQAGVNAVVLLAHDPSPQVRKRAEHAWDQIAAGDIPSIIALLQSKDLPDRSRALSKLCDFGQPAVPALIALLKDNNSEICPAVLEILGQIGPPAKEAVPSIVEVLHDRDWHCRSAAAIALGRIGPNAKPTVGALTVALKDSNDYVQVCAIEAFGRIGPDAQPASAGLIERLHDNHAAIRSAAARALGRSALLRRRPCQCWRNCGTIRKLTSGKQPPKPWRRSEKRRQVSRDR